MSGSGPGATSSAIGSAPAPAAEAWCDDEFIYAKTTDGRVVRRELPDFLRMVTSEQRGNCRVEGFGTAIHWPDIDEWLGVNWLFDVPEDVIYRLAGFDEGPFPEDEPAS